MRLMDPNVSNSLPFRLKRRYSRRSLQPPQSLPVPLNIDTHSNHAGNDHRDIAGIYLGPDLALLLPTGSIPSAQGQSPQLFPESLQLPSVPSLSASTQPSLPSSQASSMPSMSPTLQHVFTPIFFSTSPTSTPNVSPTAIPSTPIQSATSVGPAQRQSDIPTLTVYQIQSTIQSHALTNLISSSSAPGVISTPSIVPTSDSFSLLTTTPLATSSAPISSPSTQAAAAHTGNLPHLAEIVLGLIIGLSVISFLATLGSWFYKQRHRKKADFSLIDSPTCDVRSPTIFGCLRRSRNKNPEDLSELGFGLGHAGFFGLRDSRSGNHMGHHRSSVSLFLANTKKNGKKLFSRDTSVSKEAAESSFPTSRPPPAQSYPPYFPGDMSLSPSRFQHLARISATPLTVANLAPGDSISEEGGDENFPNTGPRTFLEPGAERRDSRRLVLVGEADVSPLELTENGSLAVPWAPLSVNPRNIEEDKPKEENNFQPLVLSRTSTLSLTLSRTFSQRLVHTLSVSTDLFGGPNGPVRGSTLPSLCENSDAVQKVEASQPEQDTWAATLRNNFYSALNAMGNYRGGSLGFKSRTAQSKSSSVSLLPNPFSDTSRQSSIRLTSGTSQENQASAVEDILTPAPVRTVQRTKGSIIRGKLGIDEPTRYIGLGIDTLSRTSSLSTSWINAERGSEPQLLAQHANAMDDGRMIGLRRNETASSAFSSSSEADKPTKLRVPRAAGRRPRMPRMPVTQSSVWSSESYTSSSDSAKGEGDLNSCN